MQQRRATVNCMSDMRQNQPRYKNMTQMGTQGTSWMQYLTAAELARDDSHERIFDTKMTALDDFDGTKATVQPINLVPFVKMSTVNSNVVLLKQTATDFRRKIVKVFEEKKNE